MPTNKELRDDEQARAQAEADARDRNRHPEPPTPDVSASEKALRLAVEAAVKDLRAQTSQIHNLQDAHDRGVPTSRVQLDNLKGRIDGIVQDLVTAAKLE